MATDVSGIVLHKLLSEPANALEFFPKLKPSFFGSGYLNIYTAINKFYSKHNKLPSFYDLKLTIREGLTSSKLRALEELEVPEDIEWDILIDALIDQFTQEETLDQLDKFLDTITSIDTQEIKQHLTDIVFHLEEKTHLPEKVFTFADMMVYDEQEQHSRVVLGINNTFDAASGGIALTELVMIGGARGSGKSIIAVNICKNQYLQGNTTIFFSIEMRAKEIYWRSLSALAGVKFSALRKGKLTQDEEGQVASVLKDMYTDSEELYDNYLESKDYKTLESSLSSQKKIKPDNNIVIVDNQELTLADIDMNIQKVKSQVGDKLKVVVVDYVNQIHIEDIYSWQSQISLSKGLKNLARKHNIAIVAPYQIDASGEARFAKGLLDATDIALTLKAQKHHIEFETTKTRNMAKIKFASPIDWDTLNVLPQDAIISSEEGDEEQNVSSKFKYKDNVKQDKDNLPF